MTPKTQETQQWRTDTEGGNTIAGDLIIDIKEDKKGIMWFSSFPGLTRLDTEKRNLPSIVTHI